MYKMKIELILGRILILIMTQCYRERDRDRDDTYERLFIFSLFC